MSELLNMVKLAQQGKSVPITQLTRTNPQLAAVASKMISAQVPAEHTSQGERKISAPDEHHLHQVSTNITRSVRENKSLMQMLPDLELGFQILISVCCAPKDMVTMELVLETGLRRLSPTVSGKLVQIIRDYLDNTYKIKNKIPEILRDIFQISGSHILAVLPENAIDELINRHGSISMEDYQGVIANDEFNNSIGLLGRGQDATALSNIGPVQKVGSLTAAVENLQYYDIDAKQRAGRGHKLHLKSGDNSDTFETVTITDNPNVLRNSSLLTSLRRGVIESRTGNNQIKAGLENFKLATGAITITDKILTDMIYKPRRSVTKQMDVIRTQNQLQRGSVGEPLVMSLPPESVIPVTTPGDESKHVGYFILLDETGNPVRSSNSVDGYGALAQRMMPNQSQNSAMVNRLQTLNNGIPCSNYMDVQRSVRIYADLVEQDWLASLKNGMYANGVALAKVDDIYRILLARKLQNQHSTVLFMPVESVTYFALRYNENGIGVSLMDEMKIINSQRAVLMFANTMAGIMNSMDLTDVEIKLDESDPDPQDTVEKMMDALVRANTTMFPLGVDSPSDIVSYLAKAQYAFKTTGHPGMPEMSVDVTHKQAQHGKVDTELAEQLRKYSYSALGLTLEHVDNGFNQATATSVVAESLMLSRRVNTIQQGFNPHLTDNVRKVIRASEPLCEKLRDAIKNGLSDMKIDMTEIQKAAGEGVNAEGLVVERLLSDFVNTLDVSLPKPNMATMENQSKALSAYKTYVEVGIDAYISSEMFSTEIMGEVANTMDAFKKVLVAYFMRRFMADNAILTELADLVDVDDEGTPNTHIYAQVAEHIKKAMATTGGVLKTINHDKVKAAALLQKLSEAGGADNGGAEMGAGNTEIPENSDDPFSDLGDPFADTGSNKPEGETTPPAEPEPPAEEAPPTDSSEPPTV